MNQVLIAGAALAVLLVALPAASQSGPQGSAPDPYARRGERTGPPSGGPLLPAREQGGPQGRPPMERMTPEERRQLRQDIHQHGREVYRGRRDERK